MRTSKFSIGGLIGVHISSVVNKVIRKMTFFFFLLRKNLERIKTQIEPKPTNKIKLSEQRTTKATFFRAEKLLRGGKLRFLKRTEIVLITSYTTSYVITQLAFVLIVFLVFSFLQY